MGITYMEALITRAAFKLFTMVNLRFQLIVNTKWPHYKGSGTKVPSLAGNYEALSYANPWEVCKGSSSENFVDDHFPYSH